MGHQQRFAGSAMTEEQLSRAVVKLAEHCGWLVYGIKRSDKALLRAASGAGYPDLTMLRKSTLLIVELKTTKGRYTTQQLGWLAELDEVQGVYARTWRPKHWYEGTIEHALKTLGR